MDNSPIQPGSMPRPNPASQPNLTPQSDSASTAQPNLTVPPNQTLRPNLASQPNFTPVSQPSSAPQPNPASQASPTLGQAKSKRVLVIVLTVLVLVIIGAGIAVVLTHNFGSEPVATNNPEQNDSGQNTPARSETKKALDELTKSEVIDAYVRMTTTDYGYAGFIPDFPSPSLVSPDGSPYFSLEHSYADSEEIDSSDYYVSDSGKYDVVFTPIDDYAVFATIDTDSAPIESGDDMMGAAISIAFDEDYFDYHSYEVNNSSGVTSTKTVSAFIDKSSEFINQALPLVYIGLNGSSIGSIYDFTIEEDDEMYTLTTYNIGLGLDTETWNEIVDSGKHVTTMPYALNLYTVQCTVDRETGDFAWVREEDGGKKQVFQSYSLSAEELEPISDAFEEATGQRLQTEVD